MKKIMLPIIMIGLLSTLVACKKDKDTDPSPIDPVETIENSDIDLVKNSSTEFIIVYPDNADSIVKVNAVEELSLFFREATGIQLSSKSDKDVTYQKEAKYISIGETSLLSQAGLTVDKSVLGESGVRVVQKDNSVFLFGATRFGTLYSVYEFLEHQFNFEVYAVDEIQIDRDVTNRKLLKFDTTDVPSFEYRLGSYGEFWFGQTFPRRMRVHTTNDIWISLGGMTYHNFFATVPPAQYKVDHPEWYSADGKQLCLMTDPDGLSKVVIDQMKKYINENPNANNLTFTQEDLNVWCNNETSQALRAQYGTDAAEMVLFINIVAEEIEKWAKEVHPTRDIKLVIFAYQKTEEAPARWDDTKKAYVPIDESVRLRDNVAVLYAPIFANHYHGYTHESNINYAETMKKWSAISNHLYLWSYGTYFPYYLVPYDNFNSLQDKYQFALENNAKYIFDQGQFNQQVGTDWFRLKEYLLAKLQWDAYQDMDVLIENFFDNYYKVAAPHMLTYFNEYRTWYAYLAETYAVTGYVSGTSMLNQQYWPHGVLKSWLGHIDASYEAILSLQESDPILYRQLHDRITLESISIRFLIIEFYSMFYSASDYQTMVMSLKYDTQRLGVVNYNEFRLLDDYFSAKLSS